jgi:CRISPR/Cas system CMR-associated protein Cmr5 small subunit
MKVMDIVRALGLVLLLSGCTTAAQRQYQSIAADNQSAKQNLQACTLAIYISASYDLLRKHVPYDVNQLTLQQLSDNSFATPEEIDAILMIHPPLQSCRQEFLSQISQTTPSLVPTVAIMLAKAEDSLVDLIQKKQSWGQHVSRVRNALVEGSAQMQAEGQRIIAGLSQSHEAELARRQAAFDALARYAQTQQILDVMKRPVTTNCNQFGSMINCVSH